MKRVKRIFAIVLFIIMIAVLGYTVHTCSRAAEKVEGQRIVYEQD